MGVWLDGWMDKEMERWMDGFICIYLELYDNN
jgi:hypothetical protein